MSKFKIIAGLGNPGDKYARTRHNIGFSVLDAIAEKHRLEINQSKFDSLFTRATIKGRDVILIKPLTYMNRSGISVQRFAAFYKVDMKDIIVVHDDMDLGLGQLKLVQSRGHGGHNGVRSIMESFGDKDCIRVRVGVGHPQGGKAVTGHVLGSFSPDERICMDKAVDTAVLACEAILDKGITPAMNLFNTKR